MSNRPFTPAWLAREPAATALLPRGFDDPAARAAAVQAAQRAVHPGVLEALARRPANAGASLDALRDGAVCVVTGQQMGLFGGPLFTLYKAAAAVVNARALAAETGVPCVPVFWLQSDDHDFAEIATCRVLDGEVGVPADPSDTRSVAALRFGPEVEGALDGLAELLGEGADEVMATLRACYAPGVAPDVAFAALIERMFKGTGLLVLDPRDPAMVEAARPIHLRAMAEAPAIADALVQRTQALESAGFFVQVHVRPQAPLSFVHQGSLDGPRRRVDTPVQDAPFSTSALLRPLVQDLLLPTAAYVGGPGELAYFAQLPPLYAHFGRPMPLAVPRARFRIIDATTRRLLEQTGLTPDEVALPRDALLARLGQARPGQPTPDALNEGLRAVLPVLADFTPHAAALDKGLLRATEQTAAAMAEGIERLIDRYRRTLARTDEVLVERLDRLRARLQPDGAPQERVYGWPTFAARVGVEAFTRAVLQATLPFDGGLKDLHL